MLTKRRDLLRQKVLLLDLVCVFLAYFLAAFLREGILQQKFLGSLYGNTLFVIVLSYIGIFMFCDENAETIFKRGFLAELWLIIRDLIKVGLVLLFYLFVTQLGTDYSRFFFLVFFLLSFLFIFIARSYFKLLMMAVFRNSTYSRKVLVVTTKDRANTILEQFREAGLWDMKVEYFCIVDTKLKGTFINGIEVISNLDTVISEIQLRAVDSVFIDLPIYSQQQIELSHLILGFEKMGLNVHMSLNVFDNISIENKRVGNLAGYYVVSFYSNLFDSKFMLVKRICDICGGLIGLIFTGILTIFLAPIIYIENPGPIFFSQIRVGKNGRRFRMYKFRSMVTNAEELKEELMSRNEMNGCMFKMKDDPRITKVGRFLRKTSLDEFPQFFNVVKGDMSLVGTRPPTEDEFEQYAPEYRRRISIRPGITGLWQVSGRSNITDFDEVVKMDLEYIDHWSLKNDVKIMIKTIWVVVFGRGAK